MNYYIVTPWAGHVGVRGEWKASEVYRLLSRIWNRHENAPYYVVGINGIEYHVYADLKIITSPDSGWQGARCDDIKEYRAWMDLWDELAFLAYETPLRRIADNALVPANGWLWTGWPWYDITEFAEGGYHFDYTATAVVQ